jgi:hypothetical protein
VSWPLRDIADVSGHNLSSWGSLAALFTLVAGASALSLATSPGGELSHALTSPTSTTTTTGVSSIVPVGVPAPPEPYPLHCVGGDVRNTYGTSVSPVRECLRVGSTYTVTLDVGNWANGGADGYVWSDPLTGDPSVLALLSRASTSVTVSVTFLASAPGNTTLSSDGRPTCLPRCLIPDVLWEQQVTVAP